MTKRTLYNNVWHSSNTVEHLNFICNRNPKTKVAFPREINNECKSGSKPYRGKSSTMTPIILTLKLNLTYTILLLLVVV